MTERPTSIRRALRLIWLLVGVGAAITLLAVVLSDELVRAWAGGRGLSADDTRVPPSFTPVAIVLFVVVATLLLVLMDFLRGAHNWARHCLGAGCVLVVLGGAAVIRTGPPVAFDVAAVVALLVAVALALCLYAPETSAYVAGASDEPLRGS